MMPSSFLVISAYARRMARKRRIPPPPVIRDKPIVERVVRKQSGRLAGKINAKIQKKPERFRVPGTILAFLKKKETGSGQNSEIGY